MNKVTKRSFKLSHPINQSHSTGKWGFARVNGCLDLSKCVWDSKRKAEIARSAACRYVS